MHTQRRDGVAMTSVPGHGERVQWAVDGSAAPWARLGRSACVPGIGNTGTHRAGVFPWTCPGHHDAADRTMHVRSIGTPPQPACATAHARNHLRMVQVGTFNVWACACNSKGREMALLLCRGCVIRRRATPTCLLPQQVPMCRHHRRHHCRCRLHNGHLCWLHELQRQP